MRHSPPDATKIAKPRIQRQPLAGYDPNLPSGHKTGTFRGVYARTSDLNLLSFVRISGRLCRMVQKRSTLPIGWESFLSNSLGKPVSGIPLVLLKAEKTSFVEQSRNGCQYNERLK
jgi:hypothetical protein